MENNSFLHLPADEISSVFSYIILDCDDFSSFAKLLMVWEREQTDEHIKYVLEKLDWENIYTFHNNPMEVTRDQFNGFIGYCVRYNVKQAVFFNSCQRLFHLQNPSQHLGILFAQSGTYFPSYFAFLIFKAIYRPFEIEDTAREMIQIMRDSSLRPRVEWVMKLLEDMYQFQFVLDHLLPVYKFCPNARDPDPLYQEHGPLYHETLWNSLCKETVEKAYKDSESVWGNRLQLKHIWKAKCHYCTLQLMLFKILLGVIWD